MRGHSGRCGGLGLAAVICSVGAVSMAAGCGPTLTTVAEGTGARGQEGEVLRVAWRRLLTEPGLVEYKPQEFAAATSDGRHVFVGSHGGQFYALRPSDGEVMWHVKVAGGVSSRPLYLPDSKTVYFGGDDGGLHALDAETGKERWVYKTKGPIGGAPVYEEGLIYFANGENRVYAIDAQSGAWRWQYERESPESFTIRGFSSPLLYGGRVYAGFADGYLAALNARTGDVVWARSLAGDAQRFVDVDGTPVVVDKVMYVASYAGGVYALDPTDGSVKWRFEVEGAGTVRVEGGHVYFGAARAGAYCLDLEGHVLWRQALAAQGELSTPVLLGRLLFISGSAGGTWVVEASTGRLLQFFQPGHGVSAEPMTDGKQVYVLTNNGFLYAFHLNPSAI